MPKRDRKTRTRKNRSEDLSLSLNDDTTSDTDGNVRINKQNGNYEDLDSTKGLITHHDKNINLFSKQVLTYISLAGLLIGVGIWFGEMQSDISTASTEITAIKKDIKAIEDKSNTTNELLVRNDEKLKSIETVLSDVIKQIRTIGNSLIDSKDSEKNNESPK